MSDTNNEHVALANAISRLRSSNFLLGGNLDEFESAGVQDQELLDYLARGFGEDRKRDEELENKIKGAVYLSVRRCKWKPRFCAKELAEATVHALRDARLSYLYETDKISAKQYKEECERNFVTNTVNVWKKFQARRQRIACKALLETALILTVGGPAAVVAGGIMLATELIPPAYREKIIKKTKQIARQAGEAIVEATKELYKRGKKTAKRVAEKMVDIARNIAERTATYARPVVEATRRTVSAVVDTVKEVAGKVKQKAKKFWAWLTA